MFGQNTEEVRSALKNGASIIDVRSPAEFQGGHVAGSINIPLPELAPRLSKYPKTTPVVFCCASGGRSGSATRVAKREGFEAYNGGPWTAVNGLVDLKEQIKV